MFLNTKYANFRLASSVVRTSRVRLGECELPRTEQSGNSANCSVTYLITSVSLPRLLQFSSLYLQTKYIKHHCLFLFSLKHINSCRNVKLVQGMHIHYNETKYDIKHFLLQCNYKHIMQLQLRCSYTDLHNVWLFGVFKTLFNWFKH